MGRTEKIERLVMEEERSLENILNHIGRPSHLYPLVEHPKRKPCSRVSSHRTTIKGKTTNLNPLK